MAWATTLYRYALLASHFPHLPPVVWILPQADATDGAIGKRNRLKHPVPLICADIWRIQAGFAGLAQTIVVAAGVDALPGILEECRGAVRARPDAPWRIRGAIPPR